MQSQAILHIWMNMCRSDLINWIIQKNSMNSILLQLNNKHHNANNLTSNMNENS